MATPRCTSSGCLEWTRAHDNRMMQSLIRSSDPSFSASATSLSQPCNSTKQWILRPRIVHRDDINEDGRIVRHKLAYDRESVHCTGIKRQAGAIRIQ